MMILISTKNKNPCTSVKDMRKRISLKVQAVACAGLHPLACTNRNECLLLVAWFLFETLETLCLKFARLDDWDVVSVAAIYAIVG